MPDTDFDEAMIWSLINEAVFDRMTHRQRLLWNLTKVDPQLWELSRFGRCWVVALTGETVVYFNHFEMGFNRSRWARYGVIGSYQSMQWGLGDAMRKLLDTFDAGYDVGPWGQRFKMLPDGLRPTLKSVCGANGLSRSIRSGKEIGASDDATEVERFAVELLPRCILHVGDQMPCG